MGADERSALQTVLDADEKRTALLKEAKELEKLQEKGKGGSSEEKSREAVLGIRMVFGLPDPDPLVRGTGTDVAPDPDPSLFL